MDSPKTDYAYRMVVPRNVIAEFLSAVVTVLDYDNFKNTIGGGDNKRHEAYMRCWEAMYEWQWDLKRV